MVVIGAGGSVSSFGCGIHRPSCSVTVQPSGTGCQRHYYYYYGNSPNCPPGTAIMQEGPVCEVPGQVEGGTVISSATTDEPVIVKSRRNKVVVSDSYGGGKTAWKASTPESSMTARSRVEGAIDESISR